MRAIVDWYFTAHPPIMHDLHEAQPLLYTYSGGPPQNPNLDPLLFAELPFFSNLELAQMTKYGMPGVYTHAFMDGWSPGYLGSVAYNHNGMMRMYETQSGREIRDRCARAGARWWRGAGGRCRDRCAAGKVAPRGATAEVGAGTRRRRRRRGRVRRRRRLRRAPDAARRSVAARGAPSGRGGGQPREWYRGIPIPPDAVNNFTRRNNTNYMETGVLSALQLTSMFPNLVIENFYRKTQNSIEAGKTEAPFGYVIPVQRDMTKAAELVSILRVQRIEIGQATAESRRRRQVPGRLVRDQARSAVRPPREEPAREAELPRSAPHDLRRQRLDDGSGDGRRREGDQGQVDPRRGGDAGQGSGAQGQESPATAPPASPSRTSDPTT